MLQQTRVETVLRYYEPFMRRFPDMRSLARGRRQSVLKCWEGLGYYRRAINLQKASQILDKDKRYIPSTFEGLRELPGLGDYTAAAIASIAFGEPVAAVDGNVARVMSRVLMIEGDIRRARTLKQIRDASGALISRSRPGDFNQALMDLGSSICAPRAPKCDRCPLASFCESNQAGRVEEFPVIAERSKAKSVRLLAAAFVNRGRIMLRQSGADDLWPGCWELPMLEFRPNENPGAAMRRLAEKCKVATEGESRRGPNLVHQLTHRILKFSTQIASVRQGKARDSAGARWVSRLQIARLPISTAHRKLLDAIQPMLSPPDDASGNPA